MKKLEDGKSRSATEEHIHLHYGTGSLHILRDDFVDLAVELQQLANRLDVTSTGKRNSKQERTLAVAMSDIISIIVKGGWS